MNDRPALDRGLSDLVGPRRATAAPPADSPHRGAGFFTATNAEQARSLVVDDWDVDQLVAGDQQISADSSTAVIADFVTAAARRLALTVVSGSRSRIYPPGRWPVIETRLL